jgi:hypothetical protein
LKILNKPLENESVIQTKLNKLATDDSNDDSNNEQKFEKVDTKRTYQSSKACDISSHNYTKETLTVETYVCVIK